MDNFGRNVTSEYTRPDPNPQSYAGNEFGRSVAPLAALNFGNIVDPSQYNGEFGRNLGDLSKAPQQQPQTLQGVLQSMYGRPFYG